MDVIDVRECVAESGPQWLLALADGRGAWVSWSGQSLLVKVSETTFRELWSMEFGRQDNTVIAMYLPDVQDHGWATTRTHLERKFRFDAAA